MRILIRLLPLTEPTSISLDNYPLAGLLNRALEQVAPDFSEFLHEQGYEAVRPPAAEGLPRSENKRFKFFVFSRLLQRGKQVKRGRMWFRPEPVNWLIGSPIDGIIQALALGLQAQGTLNIRDPQGAAEFGVSDLQVIEPPALASHLRLSTLSPIFAAVADKQHLRAGDSRFSESIANNLLVKYRTLHGKDPIDQRLFFNFSGQPKPQLVQYRGTDHHCTLGDFEVSGSPELIRLGWEGGFGEANSKGFGMAEVLR